MALAIFRGAARPDSIQLALDPNRDFIVPTAPELGLFLVRGGEGGPASWSPRSRLLPSWLVVTRKPVGRC